MKRHLRLVRADERGGRRALRLRPCWCGHHRLCHVLLLGRCLWSRCRCRTWLEAPPRLELVR